MPRARVGGLAASQALAVSDGTAEAPGELIEMGVITGAHGLQGAVTVKSFAEVEEDLAAYGPLFDRSGRRQFRLRLKGRTRGLLIASIPGLTDRDQAQALKGTRLFLPRKALPEPEEESYYYTDLVGLAVEDLQGRPLGRVRAVEDHGAGDLLTIARAEGGELLLPFTRQAVPTVDLARGRLIVDPPEEILVRPRQEPAEKGEDGDD